MLSASCETLPLHAGIAQDASDCMAFRLSLAMKSIAPPGSVAQLGYGLDNHSFSDGHGYNFEAVKTGNALTFVVENLTINKLAYPDPSLNGSYNDPSYDGGHYQICSSPYSGDASVPAGVYVAFEDLPYPGSDFNNNDETLVFTNVAESPRVRRARARSLGAQGGRPRLGRRPYALKPGAALRAATRRSLKTDFPAAVKSYFSGTSFAARGSGQLRGIAAFVFLLKG